jgi:hypothetical protein
MEINYDTCRVFAQILTQKPYKCFENMLLTDEKISHSLDAMKTQYFENKGFHISISLLKVQICRYILYKIFMHLQS